MKYIQSIFELILSIIISVCVALFNDHGENPTPDCSAEIVAEKQEIAQEEPKEPEAVIYDIDLAEEYQKFTAYCCEKYGVDLKLALAVMTVENRAYNPKAVSNTSDYGLFQVNEICFKELTDAGLLTSYTSILDAYTNIECGVYLLSKCEYEEPHLVACEYHNGKAGARELWDCGIWSTDYTEKVLKEMRCL